MAALAREFERGEATVYRPALCHRGCSPIRKMDKKQMANDDDDQEPLLPPPSRQQPGWLPGPYWDIPPLRRNNALYDSQPAFVPSPPTDAASALEDVLRKAAALTSAVDLLRDAVKSQDQVIGPGHNQGPPLSVDELAEVDARLIELLKEGGPKIKTAVDAKPVVEQAEKIVGFYEKIKAYLDSLPLAAAALGIHEVAKDWENVAHKILDLYNAIATWLTFL